jgi:signal transduction histidine kinase
MLPTHKSDVTNTELPQPDLNRFKEDFLNTVSHELRTPLSVISLSIDLLEKALITNQSDRQCDGSETQKHDNTSQSIASQSISGQSIYEYINIIREECSQEIKLINNLIALQQLENDNYDIFETPFDVCLWLHEALCNHCPSGSKSLNLTFHNFPESYIVSSDISAFSKIISELVDNAYKFAPDNSEITVTITQHPDSIHISFENLSAENIDVSADQTKQAKVFDAFYRIPSDDPWKFGGMGIGLSLARRLARQLDGDVWFERKQDRARATLVLAHQHSCSIDEEALLESYVAYFVSRGKAIATPSEILPFNGAVYSYWGYHRDFIQFWHQLGDRHDFTQLSLEGDTYSFGDLLSGKYSIQLCGKCLIPKPIPNARLYKIRSCGLCGIDDFLMNDHEESESADLISTLTPPIWLQSQLPTFVVVGHQPLSRELRAALRANKLNVLEYQSCDDACAETTSQTVSLIILDNLFSRVEGISWAKQLRQHPPFQSVPIVGLSQSTRCCTPWMKNPFSFKHYILGPVPGRYLASHLRNLKSQWDIRQNDIPGFYWFPA